MKIQVEKNRELIVVNTRLELPKQEPMTGIITKIGRMYFTVTIQGNYSYYGETFFLKDSCKPKDSNSNLELFPTIDHWLERRSKKRLFNNIRGTLSGSNPLNYSMDQLRIIAFILNVLED